MKTDLEIASSSTMRPISEIARSIEIPSDALFAYGPYIAKVNPAKLHAQHHAKLILVTAISPTPAGEGKTTVSIGLAEGITGIGKKAMLALREPSMGPVFGMKGGAAGGGYSQVLPMEEINLHFTGDFHAITSANNLLAALVDNHIQQGNELKIRRVVWRRCMDMNDRQLRQIVCGLGGVANGVPREDGFDITTASQIMATFCLANDLTDLRDRLARLVVGYTRENQAVTASDLKAVGSMLALLKHAFQPNLVQTIHGTPALIHGGPFANIAHGCNSVVATRTACQLADYVVTEAGFGADLGAEKFLDIKCRSAGISPDVVVIVATVRALKSHGGVVKADLSLPNCDAVSRGLPNLLQHIENIQKVYGLPVVVAINRFEDDTPSETKIIIEACEQMKTKAIVGDVWAKGGAGAYELAKEVCDIADNHKKDDLKFAYPLELSYEDKIRQLAQKIYHADDVILSTAAKKQLQSLDRDFPNLPVCIAKTQYSFSDDSTLRGAPFGFTLNVRSALLSAGAGFVVVYAGDIISMPGLPAKPAANQIDLDEFGNTIGLF